MRPVIRISQRKSLDPNFDVIRFRPSTVEYDKYPFLKIYSLRAFLKTSVFVAENAVYVWTGDANGEKITVFKNIRMRVDRA